LTFEFILPAKNSFGNGFINSDIVWQKKSDGIRENEINFILIDENKIFVATDKAVYLSSDQGKYFRKVLNISGKDNKANFLAENEGNPQIIYAATSNGLFRSINAGKSWQNVFKGKNSVETNCKAVAINQDKIYLATKQGLFFSLDNARTWNKISGELGNIEIIAMTFNRDNLYLATAEGIYSLSLDLKNQNKLYAVSQQEINGAEQEDDDYYEETEGISRINDIKVDAGKIYFGSDEGLFSSEDSGRTWQRFNQEGLLSKNIQTILLDAKFELIVVGTDEGTFEFSNNRWNQLYKGIVANKINYLATDSTGQLWAATDKGVFKGSPLSEKIPLKQNQVEDALVAFRGEPSIQEIQNQAIKYAEVQPEKIQAWRKAAARKAWLPNLSVGVDRDENLTIADSVWGTYSSGGQVYIGPDDKTFYDNFGWDVSLTWDLGDLIWNSDQTSIDSRSKLMAELREDILDEVTRLYFERRRLQTELLISPPEEAIDRLDKALRLEELTASIDALTGGYLTRRLKNE
jgi:photosystem II stability/assembly factor-like uncharacterized protein